MIAPGEMVVDRRFGVAPRHQDVEMEDEDERLCRLALSGDDSAFEALAQRHSARVISVARRLLENPEDAADAVQETFLRAYTHLRHFRGGSGFRAWLLSITVNICRNRRRDFWRWRRFLTRDAGLPPAQDPQALAEAGLEQDELDRMVRSLPEALRLPFTLRFFEELSGAEIAGVLGCPESTVWTRIYAARKELRKRLEAQEQQGEAR